MCCNAGYRAHVPVILTPVDKRMRSVVDQAVGDR